MTSGQASSWSELHRQAELLASSADAHHRAGEFDLAAQARYEASLAERKAVEAIEPGKSRTLGVTMVSAVSLLHKSGCRRCAGVLARSYMIRRDVPEFAMSAMREMLDRGHRKGDTARTPQPT